VGYTFLSLDDEAFVRSFSDFEFTAYRLETLQTYDVSYERAEFERFLAGEARGRFPGIDGWVDMVRRGVGEGKRFQRVHVLVEPLSDYVRFECAWAYRHNVAAGEDVRVIPVKQGAWPAGLPHRDYWLFDSKRLVAMNYRADGAFHCAELIDDPVEIVRACHWRDRAVALSTGFSEYAQDFDVLLRKRRAGRRRSRVPSARGTAPTARGAARAGLAVRLWRAISGPARRRGTS
jgi:hypothetical protein